MWDGSSTGPSGLRTHPTLAAKVSVTVYFRVHPGASASSSSPYAGPVSYANPRTNDVVGSRLSRCRANVSRDSSAVVPRSAQPVYSARSEEHTSELQSHSDL